MPNEEERKKLRRRSSVVSLIKTRIKLDIGLCWYRGSSAWMLLNLAMWVNPYLEMHVSHLVIENEFENDDIIPNYACLVSVTKSLSNRYHLRYKGNG